jgi:hypothetical protein
MAEYVCRYRFSLAQAIASPVLIAFSVWFVLGMIFVARDQRPGPTDGAGYVAVFAGAMTLFGAMAIVLGGAGASWLAAMITRRVALRLDQDGVTLGRMAFPPTRLVRARGTTSRTSCSSTGGGLADPTGSRTLGCGCGLGRCGPQGCRRPARCGR